MMNFTLNYVNSMLLKTLSFLSIAATSQAADVLWTNAGGDNDYNNSLNWEGGAVPSGANHALVDSLGDDRAIFSNGSSPNIDGIYVGRNSEGQLDITGGSLQANVTSSRLSRVGFSGGTGVVNQTGGSVNLNAMQVGLDSNSEGTYNLSGGDLTISRAPSGLSLTLGTAGDGIFEISGGSFLTRALVQMGVSSGSAVFSVVGSSATSIGIGSAGSLDGGWAQGANGILQVTIDSEGLTKIFVEDVDNDGVGGDVSFLSGSILDVEVDGELEEGSWVVMEWEGTLTNSLLSFAADDAILGWSLSFEDRGINGAVEGPDSLVITYEEPVEGVNLIKQEGDSLFVELELGEPDLITVDGVDGFASIVGNAIFASGSILDVELTGEPELGSWDVLQWGGQLSDNGLTMDSEDALNGWSFSFADRIDGDGKLDTLVVAYEKPEDFVTESQFVHPGISHKRSDLDRVKYMVQAQIDPWYSSYQEMSSNPDSNYDYLVQGNDSFTLLARDSPATNYGAWNSDIRAAYYNAIRWYVTGDSRHAEKCIEIFDAWRNLRSVTSNGTDALSGGVGYIMIEAAEIIKSTYDGWEAEDIQSFKDMLVYPGYSNTDVPVGETTFYWKSYQGDAIRHGNQGLSGFRTVMAMGIFLDNPIMYDRALRYVKGLTHRPDDLPYPSGPNTVSSLSATGDFADTYNVVRGFENEDYGYNEVMTNYIYENGQCQESSRDQQHTVFGISLLNSMAEMAWNQGEDLYGHADDRLLLGLEYNMRYNVSSIQSYEDQPIPWVPTVESGEFLEGFERTGRWFSKAISTVGLGDYSGVRPVFEMPVAHYVGRGLKTEEEVKWTIRARDVAIELSGLENEGHVNDAIGWGALTERRPGGCYGDPISGFDGEFPIFAINALPGVIEAENFDHFATEGEGRTYSDLSPENTGNTYRIEEGVDIEVCSEGGYNVTDMESGEWLAYTVNVPIEGLYEVSVRYASESGGGRIRFEFGEDNSIGDISLPATGSGDTWGSYVVGDLFSLNKGVQPMRVYVTGDSNAYELNSITIDLKETTGFNAMIEAEDFASGVSVSVEESFDLGGGSHLDSLEDGMWSRYLADLGNESVIKFRIARPEGTPDGRIEIHLALTGDLVGSVDVPITGGWQEWKTVETTIGDASGLRNVYLVYLQSEPGDSAPMFNFNWFAVDSLGVPSEFRVDDVGASYVELDWDSVSGATGYVLKRSLESGGNYETVSELLSFETSFIDVELEAGSPYYYTVSAVKNGIEGSTSDELVVIPSIELRESEGDLRLELEGNSMRALIPNTVKGHFYQLMESESLVNPTWIDVGEAVLGDGDDVFIELPFDVIDSSHFYRLLVYR